MSLKCNRAIAAAAAAAIALTSVSFSPAMAAPVSKQQTVASGDLEVSAQRRRHYRGNNDRAVLGAMLGIFGTVAALAAADRYRDRGYYGGPGYYGGGPYYAPPAYGYHGPYGYRRW